MGLHFVYRVDVVRRRGLHLSARRRVTIEHRAAVLIFTLLLQICYLVPNILLLRDACTFFDSYSPTLIFILLEWLCWGALGLLMLLQAHWHIPLCPLNTSWLAKVTLTPRQTDRSRPDAGAIDLGWDWRLLAPKLAGLAFFYGIFLTLWTLYNTHHVMDDWRATCQIAMRSATPKATIRQLSPDICDGRGSEHGFTIALVVLLIVALFWFTFLLAAAWKELSLRPYKGYRMANQTLRTTIATTFGPLFIITLSMAVLWLGDWDSCDAAVLVWPGLAPAHVQIAAYCCIMTLLSTPFPRVMADTFHQGLLQEFTWREEDMPRARDARIAAAGSDSGIGCEPMFCMETALLAGFASHLVYEDAYGDEGATHLPQVMEAFGLDSSVTFHERATALHVVAAWSNERVIVAFRGTVEPANIRHDMQFCLAAASADIFAEAADAVGSKGMAVHRGFRHTWMHGGQSTKIVSFLSTILGSLYSATGKHPQVLLCGHSLGGALATLCAIDIRQRCGDKLLPRNCLSVYTFGSPRVGTHALARFYDARITCNHWNIVNAHDVVAHGGKLCGAYKHVGQRVLVNAQGDIIVRPSFVEASFQHWLFSERLADHFLRAYRDSTFAICCQYGITDERLSLLLQAIGAPPLGRKHVAVSLEEFRATEEQALQREARMCGGFLPQWLRALMARVRRPDALMESRGDMEARRQAANGDTDPVPENAA